MRYAFLAYLALMPRLFPFVLLLLSTASFAQDVCLSEEELKLYNLIMQYRKSNRLKSIPISTALTRVAQAHVRDLSENYDASDSNPCNPHSWSDNGKWSSCCYTPDHKQASCMWNKPKEISGYEGIGFEIAYYSSAGANAVEGLEGWKKSPGHNPVIINLGTWSKTEWKAIGIGIYKEYGVVWFGEVEDKEKPPVACK
jgi:uncharacterized protein YkwD